MMNGHGEGQTPRTDGEVLLEAESITIGYGPVAVVQDLSVTVRRGQVVVLMGPNGAGKTTTLMALSGALPIKDGIVRWKGKPTKAPLHRRARNGIGLVNEARGIFKQLSVAENLKVGGVDTDRVLAIFPELEKRLNVKAGMVSGGEQQMLAVGRAICRDSELLITDELSLGLAPMVVDRLLRVVRDAADAGTGVLLVEQNVHKALEIADHGYVLERGSVVVSGSAANLKGRLAEIEATYLGQTA